MNESNSSNRPVRPPNYDEAKVAPYTLEDPLSFASGEKLTSPDQWPRRREEILGIFAREMYGAPPPPPEALVADMTEEGPTLNGLAIRRQYRMWFKADRTGPFVDWLLVLPNRIGGLKPQFRDGRVVCENAEKTPVVILLNYHGNHQILDDPEVPLPENVWLRNDGRPGAGRDALECDRGRSRRSNQTDIVPAQFLVARGYALLTACYGQVSPDPDPRANFEERLAYTKVFDLWPPRDPARDDNTTALGAWAWALSRGLDLAERIPEIDAAKAVATGCSRLAKTAILAAARDTRFAVCVANQSGGGGAPLAKRDFGENVSTEMAMFPHWYCRAYGKYAGNEQSMAFDQHLLLASIAPRPLLVEGFNSLWFDPRGEWLSCRAASCAWEFLGQPGLPEGDFPENYSTKLIGPRLGYVRRGGDHGIAGHDWMWMLDFADQALGRP